MAAARILIIEDDLDNREMVKFLLQRSGFDVMGAPNGTDGLAMAQENVPDLILLDMTLPGMDGWQLAHQLKGDPLTQHIPIIALTAHTLPGDRKRALDSGCDGYISKPISVQTFADEVKEYLK